MYRPGSHGGASGRPTRRQLLATAAVAAVAGCLGGGVGEGSSPSGGGVTDATETPADVERLQSLEVGGSPGGTLPVREPGTVSLVDFFATWCAPCEPQMETLGTVRAEFDRERLYMTSVTAETEEAAIRRFWRSNDGTWPVLLDPELTVNQAYGVKGIPTLVLVDGEGGVVWRHRGLAGEDTLRTKVREAIEG